MDSKSLIYQFDDVRVDLGRFEVMKADVRIRLEPKAFETLVFLIQNRGRLVEKNELLDVVWKDSFVSENAMTRVIAQVRKALGEDSKEAKYIETVPTRGYRFIPEVEVTESAESGVGSRESGQRSTLTRGSEPLATQGESPQKTSGAEHIVSPIKRNGTVTAVLVAGLIIALSVLIYFIWKSKSSDVGSKAIDSVAVLPFANVGADPDTEYLSDGISESLINSLSQLPRLTVISRDSAFRYKGLERSAQTVGQELKVQAVLTGRVVQRGDNLSISVELVDVRNNSHLWGEQYQQKLADILQVQEQIARKITEKLRLRLTGEEQKQLTKRYTQNTETYELYLKGHYHLNKRGPENVKKAIGYFEQAVAKDPGYALAYAELAFSYGFLSDPSIGLLSPREAVQKGKGALLRALELDDTLAEAHDSLAWLNLYERDWLGAEREFTRAIELNPNLTNARLDYSVYLSMVGRHDDAIGQVKRALEIDPLDIRGNRFLGERFCNAHRYDEAIEQLRKTLDLDANYPGAHETLGWVYEEKGMYDEAIAEYSKMRSLTGDSPEILSYLGRAYAGAGQRDEAQKMISELKARSQRRYVSAYLFAWIYARLGDKERALGYLEKGYVDRDQWLTWIKVDPVLDSVRSDPRFTDLMRRVGFPQS